MVEGDVPITCILVQVILALEYCSAMVGQLFFVIWYKLLFNNGPQEVMVVEIHFGFGPAFSNSGAEK